MKIHICYPPQAYPFMPHLATHYLRGYIEAEMPGWEASVSDLNIQYHRDIWSKKTCDRLADEAASRNATAEVVLAELLAQNVPRALELVRDQATYKNPDVVAESVALLKLSYRLVAKIDSARKSRFANLPKDYGQWQDLLTQAQGSVVGEYLEKVVGQGFFDEHDVVGLSIAYVEQILPAQLLAKLIKARRPETIVLFGGAGFTHIDRYAERDLSFWDYVDYGVSYEGEFPLKQLLFKIQGIPVPEIPNVMYREGDAIRYKRDNKNLPKTFATPNFDGLEDVYPTPEIIYPLLTTKGCYWGKCSYCTHHESYGKGYYAIPNEYTESGLDKLLKKGATSFYFVDEALPLAKVQMLAGIFEKERVQNGTDIKWIAEARIEKNYAANGFAEALVRSGCRLLINGIESGSAEMLKVMSKGIDLQGIAKICRDVRSQGVRVGWMFFIGHPGETPAQAQETMQYVRDNRESVDYISVGCFSLEHGSPIWNNRPRFKVSEIIGEGEPYRLDYPFRLEGSAEISTKDDLFPKLNELFLKNRDLEDLMTSAIDRAVAMFLPTSAGRASQKRDCKVWESRRLSRNVSYDPNSKRFELRQFAAAK